MASIGKLMKQAAKMQQQMQEAQAQLADKVVEASSGGGAVKVSATCDGAVKSCLLYTSPSPRDATLSRMPSSA